MSKPVATVTAIKICLVTRIRCNSRVLGCFAILVFISDR